MTNKHTPLTATAAVGAFRGDSNLPATAVAWCGDGPPINRAARDQLVRRLRDEDPARWTYSALAGAVGCDQQLIRWILKGDRTRKR